MEPIAACFLLILLGLLLVLPILGFVGWLTSRRNHRRLFELEQRIMDLTTLEQRVAALARTVREGVPAEAAPEPPAGPLPEQAAVDPVARPGEVRVPPTAAEIRAPEPTPSPEPASPAPQPIQAGGSADTTASAEAEEAVTSREDGAPGVELPEPAAAAMEAAEAPRKAPPGAPPGTAAGSPPGADTEAAEASRAATAASPAGEPGAVPPPPPQPPAPPEAGRGDQGSTGPPRIDWERWIGLRGAAVLGGIVLALAGALFLKYSIDAGYFPPRVRVTLAIFGGLGALAGSQFLRRRGYEPTANALAGAGVVILYGALWAAQALYDLIGAGTAFGLMTLVTVVCGLLSWRYRSWVVAGLGLAGGFATPAVLTSVDHNPLSLFSYLFLLNLGVLILARKRGWPVLGLCSLALTAIYQVGWLFGGMGDGDTLLGMGVVAIFAILYAATAGRQPRAEEGNALTAPWLGPAAAVSLAFVFALHLSGSAVVGEHHLPFLGLLLLLSAAALWLSRVHRVAWLPLAAAGANLAAVFNWLRVTGGGRDQEWLVIGASLVLAAAFHGAAEWLARQPREETAPEIPRAVTLAAVLVTFGLLLVLTLPLLAPDPGAAWPWILSWLALGGLVIRQSSFEGFEPAQPLAALGVGIGFCFLLLSSSAASVRPAPWALLAVFFLGCLGLQALSLQRSGRGRLWADVTAALLPLLMLLSLVMTTAGAYRTPLVFLGSSLLLAFLMVVAATRQRSGKAYAGAVAVVAFAHLTFVEEITRVSEGQVLVALALHSLAVLLFTLWPRFASRAFSDQRWAWYAAALAGPAWFLPVAAAYGEAFGDGSIGVVPLALGALSLSAAFSLRRLWSADDPRRRSGLVWFGAVALGFVALTIPLQLEKEWITVGWALQAVATIALWRRLDHPGLKYFSLGLLAAVTLRLLANPAVLGYHPVSGIPLFNWLSYTYLVPAACLLGGAYLLHDLEVKRRRSWEEGIYGKGWATGAAGCGLAAILVVFAWINLSIVDYFSTGDELAFSFERAAARDLTTSLAWAVYAVLLLAIGIQRKWTVLRWVSLAFLILTIGKVFLYDLGELEDLYRVASLVGLAISLILVSLVYQRFVFREDPKPLPPSSGPATGDFTEDP